MMIIAFPYMLKVSIILSVLYLIYFVALRNLKFLVLNRVYLLGAAVLALTIPLLPAPWEPGETTMSRAIDLDIRPGVFIENEMHALTVDEGKGALNLSSIILAVYLTGVMLLMARTVMGLRTLIAIVKSGTQSYAGPDRVVRITQEESFCFFGTVVIGASADHTIYLHEHAHARQRHWIDLLLAEILTVILWFNPVVWLWKKSLRQVHEYLADDFVLKSGIAVESYLQVFLQTITFEKPIGHVNKFNSQSLKQRITMMTNNENPSYQKLFYLLVLPALALAFLSFTQPTSTAPVASPDRIIVIDPAHGGDDGGSRSVSGVSEKDVTLAIAKLVSEIGTQRGMTIILTRTADQSLTLKDRVAIPSDRKASVFVSLHLASDNDPGRKGMQIFVSEENARFSESKRLSGVLLEELKSFGQTPEVKSSPAFVLKNNPLPSAIIELGYLSNESDATFITNTANQRKIAERIVSGLAKF